MDHITIAVGHQIRQDRQAGHVQVHLPDTIWSYSDEDAEQVHKTVKEAQDLATKAIKSAQVQAQATPAGQVLTRLKDQEEDLEDQVQDLRDQLDKARQADRDQFRTDRLDQKSRLAVKAQVRSLTQHLADAEADLQTVRDLLVEAEAQYRPVLKAHVDQARKAVTAQYQKDRDQAKQAVVQSIQASAPVLAAAEDVLTRLGHRWRADDYTDFQV